MTKQTRAFMGALQRCLAENRSWGLGDGRAKLMKLHLKMTGRALSKFKLSTHLACRQTPNMDTALVYIRFAAQQGMTCKEIFGSGFQLRNVVRRGR